MSIQENKAKTVSQVGPTKSILARLSLIYVSLTFLNIVIFYVAAGANQIRLISEKANSSVKYTVSEVRRSWYAYSSGRAGRISASQLTSEKANLLQMFNIGKSGKPILENFNIINSERQMLLSHPEQAQKTVSPETDMAVFKVMQMNQISGQTHLIIPDLLNYSLELYVLLNTNGLGDLVLKSTVALPFLREEFHSLIRLAIGMVILLMAVQSLLGLIIYRTLVQPITKLSAAANNMAAGDFITIEHKIKRDDEVLNMLTAFNEMSVSLKSKTETIQHNLIELKKKDEMITFDLNLAQKIQKAILPQTLKVRQLQAEVTYTPLLSVSGDYYDIMELTDGSVAVFMGDASGHGVPAAFLTIMAKVYFSSLVEKFPDPGKLLTAINESMSRFFGGNSLYLTAFYMRIYPDNRAEYCNCMHPEPIIYSQKNGEFKQLPSEGFFIGILETPPMEFVTRTLEFSTGDRILLYTDGLSEAANAAGDLLGAPRARKLFEESVGEDLASGHAGILRKLQEFTGGRPYSDDLTIFSIEITASHAPGAAALSYFGDKNYAAASLEFEALIKRGQEPLEKWRTYQAESILRLRRIKEAMKLFSQLNADFPENISYYFKIGVCRLALKDYVNAAQIFEGVCQKDPGHALALAHWALASFYQNNSEQASTLLAQAEKLRANSPVIKNINRILNTRQPG